MDYGLIITAILSSAGVFGLIQFLISRHDNKKGEFNYIKRELKALKKSQNDTNVKITRMELLGLIRNDPDNVDTILEVAEYYFIELYGNAYAHAIFEKWAVEHGVAIGWLPKLKKGVKNGKKSSKI